MFGATIFLSAFLLFSLEPLVGKLILPWFGGSAAVWSTCLVFYQTALFAGYFYARLLSRIEKLSWQIAIHMAMLAASLCLLPVGPGGRWAPGVIEHPVGQILGMLAATIGLPFLGLSATSPLLQHWLASSRGEAPYRLFAVSNFASLAALLAYPTIIEPQLGRSLQRIWWSAAYAVFAVLCAVCGWVSRESRAAPEEAAVGVDPSTAQRLIWFALAACSSMLLLAITNHITENVAAVPLLWVLPLAIYLLTFVLAFGSTAIGGRTFWLRMLAVGLGAVGYGIYNINAIEALQVSLPIFLFGLFAGCMFCHAELNRRKPDARYLTDFYLMIAAGGACGAIFVGIVCPQVFSGIYELPLTLVAIAAAAAAVTWGSRNWVVRALWLGMTAAMAVVFAANVKAYRENTLTLRRSFYGSLRVVQSRRAGETQTRTLFHGTIEHGAQFVLLPMRLRPTTYYGPDSGIGIVLRECFSGPKRVGVVGLGVGTVAAYGRPGDTFRFYEINPQVEDIAGTLFTYLRESKARVEIVPGDARLSLDHETTPPLDVLALDAFSGDSIPVHLLTREAIAIYGRRLKPDGVLAFHVSNNFLDLASVVKRLADDAGYGARVVRAHEDDDELTLAAEWVIVTKNQAALGNSSLKTHTIQDGARGHTRIWTDDYNNLLEILKTPEVK